MNKIYEVLANETNQFYSTLENLALRKASSNEGFDFEHVLIRVNRKISDESFQKINKKGWKKIEKL